MPLFRTTKNSAKQLKKRSFRNEKELQSFVENNLETLFGVRFLASEFTTSQQHGGRIDSLGLDENNSPVIIEYKWGEKDNIINQGLFYLDWLVDHTGDFQLLVHEKLGNNIKVDYGSPRLILVAQSFSKYDQYAINRMAENIELWNYSRYEDDLFELKLTASSQARKGGDKKRITKVSYEEYDVEHHIKNKSPELKELFKELRERVLALESDHKIEENPRKHYIAYRTNKNFTEFQLQSSSIKIFIDLPKDQLEDPKDIARDMTNIGHYGTGDVEVVLKNFDDLEYVLALIEQSYLQSS